MSGSQSLSTTHRSFLTPVKAQCRLNSFLLMSGTVFFLFFRTRELYTWYTCHHVSWWTRVHVTKPSLSSASDPAHRDRLHLEATRNPKSFPSNSGAGASLPLDIKTQTRWEDTQNHEQSQITGSTIVRGFVMDQFLSGIPIFSPIFVSLSCVNCEVP